MANGKWYSSQFFSHLGEGLAVTAVILGCAYGCRHYFGPTEKDIELEKARAPVIQSADLNGNGIADKFYVVDGKIAVVELDGKPVAKTLDSKIHEK
ncbi:MAG: hypothetical protein AABX66_04140 [Nanoarchaeota archaeon]